MENKRIKQLAIFVHLDFGRPVIILNVIIDGSVNIIPDYLYLTRPPATPTQMVAKLILSLPVLISREDAFIVIVTFPHKAPNIIP